MKYNQIIIALIVPKWSREAFNLIEGSFAQLTDRRPKKGAFTSVQHLEEEIGIRAEGCNEDPKPFNWKTPAKEIITKARRGLTIVLGRCRGRPLEGC
jgi:hypothetical protein